MCDVCVCMCVRGQRTRLPVVTRWHRVGGAAACTRRDHLVWCTLYTVHVHVLVLRGVAAHIHPLVHCSQAMDGGDDEQLKRVVNKQPFNFLDRHVRLRLRMVASAGAAS